MDSPTSRSRSTQTCTRSRLSAGLGNPSARSREIDLLPRILHTLQPRQMAGVEMRVTITSFLEDGATVKWNTIPVTFTVYGIERHVFAPMNVQIDLVGSKTDC